MITKLEQERDRLINYLSSVDPGTDEYERLLKELNDFDNIHREDLKVSTESSRIEAITIADIENKKSETIKNKLFWIAPLATLGAAAITVLGQLHAINAITDANHDGIVDRDGLSIFNKMR